MAQAKVRHHILTALLVLLLITITILAVTPFLPVSPSKCVLGDCNNRKEIVVVQESTRSEFCMTAMKEIC